MLVWLLVRLRECLCARLFLCLFVALCVVSSLVVCLLGWLRIRLNVWSVGGLCVCLFDSFVVC